MIATVTLNDAQGRRSKSGSFASVGSRIRSPTGYSGFEADDNARLHGLTSSLQTTQQHVGPQPQTTHRHTAPSSDGLKRFPGVGLPLKKPLAVVVQEQNEDVLEEDNAEMFSNGLFRVPDGSLASQTMSPEDINDRDRERKADGDHPFEVDRRVLREIVQDKMHEFLGEPVKVTGIRFLSSGTFHKAFIISLSSTTHPSAVFRIARRFIPRLKTLSEVATMNYLSQHTEVPVPQVYAYDASPYNRLGGEWILMAKAKGVPLGRVWSSLVHDSDKVGNLLNEMAKLVVGVWSKRWRKMGSLYEGKGDDKDDVSEEESDEEGEREGKFVYPLTPVNELMSFLDDKPSKPTIPPTSKFAHLFSHLTPAQPVASSSQASASTSYVGNVRNGIVPKDFRVGPIISWPFFGSGRGDLSPSELDRGPWWSTSSYLSSCSSREIHGVRRENEGKAKPHRLHLDPDDRVRKYGFGVNPGASDSEDSGSESDDGDSSDSSSSGLSDESVDDEDAFYRDYRKHQRSTFLVAELLRREKAVKEEMAQFVKHMQNLQSDLARKVRVDLNGIDDDSDDEDVHLPEREEFALDCHDLSFENVFVDEDDNSKISCIIDWESTTTRPLWGSAHLPSFLLSPSLHHIAHRFRSAVAKIANPGYQTTTATPRFPKLGGHIGKLKINTSVTRREDPLAHAAKEWLVYERHGEFLRCAHKCVEFDGWEEGLVHDILEEVDGLRIGRARLEEEKDGYHGRRGSAESQSEESDSTPCAVVGKRQHNDGERGDKDADDEEEQVKEKQRQHGARTMRVLDPKGDFCAGVGGELGRRLREWVADVEIAGASFDASGTQRWIWEEDSETEET